MKIGEIDHGVFRHFEFVIQDHDAEHDSSLDPWVPQARIQGCWKGEVHFEGVPGIASAEAAKLPTGGLGGSRFVISRRREMTRGQFVWGVGEK
jgi:hypothetical protein